MSPPNPCQNNLQSSQRPLGLGTPPNPVVLLITVSPHGIMVDFTVGRVSVVSTELRSFVQETVRRGRGTMRGILKSTLRASRSARWGAVLTDNN